MTAQRQENKGRGINYAFKTAVLAAIAALVWSSGPIVEAVAAITEQVVVNRHTGLAIDGFDPVAYFTEGAAMHGSAEVELAERGVIWRFRNEGNRAAFKARPDVYSPRFGGYDPIDIARGKPVAGQAKFWVIHGERLFLFHRDEHRTAFAADPEGVYAQAMEKWPEVLKGLSDY